MVISGCADGVVAISNPTSGLVVQVISDHQGAPITDLHSSTNTLMVCEYVESIISKLPYFVKVLPQRDFYFCVVTGFKKCGKILRKYGTWYIPIFKAAVQQKNNLLCPCILV